jgi:DNA-binding transcriptional LysR family regulator
VLRVGFQTSAAGPLDQVTMERFSDAHPGWRVELKMRPWSDPTAGLLDATSDVAFLWLPVPGQDRLAWQTLWTEPRHIALWCTHPLAERAELRIADLLDEPFVALPPAAGPLRDHWLALAERDGHAVRIGAMAETPDETLEAVAAQQGVALMAAGNAEVYARRGITAVPVVDIAPAEFAVAWRDDDARPIVREYGLAAEQAVEICAAPDTAIS